MTAQPTCKPGKLRRFAANFPGFFVLTFILTRSSFSLMRARFLAFWLVFASFSPVFAGKPIPAPFDKMGVYDLLDYAAPISLRRIDSALVIVDFALGKAIAAHDWEAIFYCLREPGIYREYYNQPSEAIPEYQKALAILDSMPVAQRDKYRATILTDLAIVHRKCGLYSACKRLHEEALAIGQRTNNAHVMENSFHGIGFLYETVGDWTKAQEWYQKSVEMAERSNNVQGIVISSQNMAQVLQKSGNGRMALEKIEEAWRLSARCDSTRRAHVLNDFGEILAANHRLDEALAKFKTSLLWYEKQHDRQMIARAQLNLANVHAQLGNKRETEDFFQKSLALREAIRPEDLVKLLLDLAQLQAEQGKLAEAKTNLDECLSVSEHYNFRSQIQAAFQQLASLSEQRGDNAGAYFFLKKAMTLADSLAGHEEESRVAQNEFRFETERREADIVTLKSQNTKMLLGGLAGGLALLLAFFAFGYRQKAKHNRALQWKNEEIERSNQQLRESNQVLQQFAYATAHDLKEPLRTIGSFVGLLEKRHGQLFPPEAIEYFAYVKSGTFRMNTLLTDLLEYSTVFMDTPGPAEKADVAESLHEVMSNLQETIRKCGATVELPVLLPNQFVSMKKTHFIQLFQNLVSNAIKFSPEQPKIALSLTVEPDGNYRFAVRDNGIGIAPAYRDKVFQIFQRLDRQRFEGAGIGLAICKNIVDKYGGTLWFESELGRGTTFFVRIPAAVEVPAELALN